MSARTFTVPCEHCRNDLEVTEHTLRSAHQHADDTITCSECAGRQPYPDDVPECGIKDCEMPAPFAIHVDDDGDPIRRCREDLRRELNGESWNDWRFYRGDE